MHAPGFHGCVAALIGAAMTKGEHDKRNSNDTDMMAGTDEGIITQNQPKIEHRI